MPPSTALTIRPMRSEDLASAVSLVEELGYPATLEDVAARFWRLGRREDHGLFVAELEQEVVGWLHVLQLELFESGPCAEIGGLVVGSDARRTGAGRALVERAIAWARSRGHDRLQVRSNVVRREAHRFYPALGFSHRKTQHLYELALSPSPADR